MKNPSVRRLVQRPVTKFVCSLAITTQIACSAEEGGLDSADSSEDTSGIAPSGSDPNATSVSPPGSLNNTDVSPSGDPTSTSVTPGTSVGPNDSGGVNPAVDPGPSVAPPDVLDENGKPVTCGDLTRPPTPLRRLTRFEYNNTVRDLFGTSTTPADAFPPDEVSDGFNNNALLLTVSSLHAEKYMEAAELLAAEAVNNLSTLNPCDTAAMGEQACAEQFANRFGRKAFRRNLEPADVTALMDAFAAGQTYEKGIEVMIRAILQSPHFLYRVEFTGTETAGSGMIRVNGYETASRLSYLIWGSTPDDALLSAAEAGQLSTPEQVAATARTMLADERAKRGVAEFYRQWAGLTRLDIVNKDVAAFPLWSDDMRAAMDAESTAVVSHTVWGQTPTLANLLTAPVGLARGPLAELYGVDATDQIVSLPADQRAGILTMPAFLAVQAHPDQTAPVLRGKFVYKKLLCRDISPPPPELMDRITVPTVTEDSTARERFSAHSEEVVCAACHQYLDPPGFALENYDALGVYRTTENGKPIDTTGQFVGTRDINESFDGVIEMAALLARSEQVQDCVAKQWLTFALGRGIETGDTCSVAPVQDAFTASGGNLSDLMIQITQSEAFLYRRATAAEVTQ
jgi:Protein of unknown function (DUF1592)/Protein of unknown function (DUF1588)/Protein of unknown function (DUF1587)/Protein of unknown function (DUF1585)/Protein of unknown function (DUF1595)